jgi:hypothetical protein
VAEIGVSHSRRIGDGTHGENMLGTRYDQPPRRGERLRPHIGRSAPDAPRVAVVA